jgi:Ead/Ea22-like protein
MDLKKLRELAGAATPGPWTGDRIDGTVKYCIMSGKTVVCRGDNYNSESGPWGFMDSNDDEFVLAANPATVITLLDELETLRAVLQDILAAGAIKEDEYPLLMARAKAALGES